MGKFIDITGQTFGRLTVEKRHSNRSVSGGVLWECLCECGNKTITRSDTLREGRGASCGCLNKEIVSKKGKKHGLHNTPTYRTWTTMKQRCQNPNNPNYKNGYGGKGITVCKEWEEFGNFLRDMGERPNSMTLDRIDYTKRYSKDNCRWATIEEQARNKKSNRFYTIQDKTQCLTDWSTELGIPFTTLHYRLKRLPVEEVLTINN